jgi:hypothetical protein
MFNNQCSLLRTRGNNGNILVSFILKQAIASKVKLKHSSMLSWQGSTHSSIEKSKKQYSRGWTLKRQPFMLNWQTFNPIFFWQVQKTIVLAVKKFFPLSIFWVLFAFKGYYFATLIINKMNANIYPYLLTYLINLHIILNCLKIHVFQYVSFHFMIEYKVQVMGSQNLNMDELVTVRF